MGAASNCISSDCTQESNIPVHLHLNSQLELPAVKPWKHINIPSTCNFYKLDLAY